MWNRWYLTPSALVTMLEAHLLGIMFATALLLMDYISMSSPVRVLTISLFSFVLGLGIHACAHDMAVIKRLWQVLKLKGALERLDAARGVDATVMQVSKDCMCHTCVYGRAHGITGFLEACERRIADERVRRESTQWRAQTNGKAL